MARSGGVWPSLARVLSLESDGWFCAGAFDSNLSSVYVKMFSHVIQYMEEFLLILYPKCDLQNIMLK
jgi:hypothetical protein